MPQRITEQLLRKRSEHNDGILATLKEVTLHQFEIERIENLEHYCRELEQVFLQNNLIGKLENLGKLKRLWYLNLAINNIKTIENLQGCESLEKLDLTCNFVDDLLSVESLQGNYSLRHLHLLGNPCTQYTGYRPFVVATLPQLESLDGTDIDKSERILATQDLPAIRAALVREAEERAANGDAASPSVARGDAAEDAAVPYTPEARLALHRELEEKRNAHKKPASSAKKTGNSDNDPDAAGDAQEPATQPAAPLDAKVVLRGSDGRVLQRNEGGWTFRFDEDQRNTLVLHVMVARYLDTSAIDVDLQPEYIVIVAKGKRMQLVLPAEVYPDRATAERSKATGELVLTMPRVKTNRFAGLGSRDVYGAASRETKSSDGEGNITEINVRRMVKAYHESGGKQTSFRDIISGGDGDKHSAAPLLRERRVSSAADRAAEAELAAAAGVDLSQVPELE